MNKPKYVYYNARLDNATNADSNAIAKFAIYDDSRPAPIISNASDYTLSIVRFSSTLQSIPALLVEPGEGDSWLVGHVNTAYSFTITRNGVDFSAVVPWKPESDIRIGDKSPFDPYFWCYSYIYFNGLVNKTLAKIADDAGLIHAPFFKYDTASATFSLYATEDFLLGEAALFADVQAHYLYAGFPGVSSSTFNKEFQYTVAREAGEGVVVFNGVDYAVREQTPGSLCNWNPCKSFLFTSASLPVVPEQTNNFGTRSSGTGQLASQRIITDLLPNIVRGDELRSGQIIYNPTAEYRHITLVSSSPINRIDWSLYWTDIYGGEHQFVLLHNGYVSVKFLFELK